MNELLENFGFQGFEEVALVFLKSLREFEVYLTQNKKHPDLAQLKKESHRLKSALGSFGQDETAALCEKLEHETEVAIAEADIEKCLAQLPGVSARIQKFLDDHRPTSS
jgi:HPt (histidine-containing phosphotransfer) domain-containing protein